MSQYDPNDQFPGGPQTPFDAYAYPMARPYGSAPTLLKVCAILNIVMAALDILWSCLMFLGAILIKSGGGIEKLMGPEGPIQQAPQPGDPPLGVVVGVVAAFGVVALLAGIFKLIGGIKVLKRTPGAFGFGLAGGIIGCTQLWCSYFCILPMAIGIFTIVALCLQNSRNYLRDSAAGALAGTDGSARQV